MQNRRRTGYLPRIDDRIKSISFQCNKKVKRLIYEPKRFKEFGYQK